jgi:hypothetical protein
MRMKKLLTFLTLLTLFFATAWADQTTYSMSFQGSANGTNDVTWNANTASTFTHDGITWSHAEVFAGTAYYGTLKTAATFGSKNNPVTSVELSTTDFAGKTIVSVTLNGSCSNSEGPTVTITAGSTTMLDACPFVKTTYTDYTTTTNNVTLGTGEALTFTINNPNNNPGSGSGINVASITVVYEDGGSQTVAAPTISLNPASGPYYEGDNVTVNMSCTTPDATISYKFNDGNWTTYNNSNPPTISATTTIQAKAAKNGVESTVNTQTITFNAPIANIAAFKQLANNAEFKFAGDVVVTYVNETDTRYVWVKDNSGSAVFFNTLSPVPNQCDVIKGGWKGKKTIYSGLHEIINVTGANIQGSEEVTPAELQISDITTDNQSTYGYVRNVVITSKSGKDFYFTADGTTSIHGYNTYDSDQNIEIPDADNSKRYDILGIVNVHSTVQFTPIAFEEVQVAPSAEYYLVGDMNNWGDPLDTNYKFNKQLDGSYVLNFDNMPNNIRFKIAKVENDTQVLYGGTGIDGQDYGIHSGHHNDIHLNGNDAFFLAAGKSTIFTLDADAMTFDVERPQLFIRGSFDGWSDAGVEMTTTETGWTYTRELAGGAGFGFVDGWGNWHGKEWLIKEEHLGTDIPIETSNNYTVEDAGEYTINVNKLINTLVVTKKAESSGDEFVLVKDASTLNENDEVIIVNGTDGSLKTISNTSTTGNNRPATDIVVEDESASATDETAIFTLVSAEGDFPWQFASTHITGDNKYLTGSTSNNNRLTYSNGSTNASKAKIEIDNNGNTSIVFNATRGVMQYNESSVLFNCYSTASQDPVYLYKRTLINRSDEPEIVPGSKTIEGGYVQVTITAAQGAAIYYTTDGSMPDKNNQEQLYEGPIDLWSTGGRKVVTAIAVENGKDASYPVSVTYLFTSPEAPTFDPASGTVRIEPFSVTISSKSEYGEDAKIYYLLDPATPPTAAILYNEDNLYEGPVNISGVGTHTIYALVYLNNIKSEVAVATYSIADSKTLAEIITLGENADGKPYTISNDLLGVYKNGTSIWFKDEAQAVDYQNPTAASYEYYTVVEQNLDINKSEKDFAQNNWIEVVFPSEQDFTKKYVRNLTGTYSCENGNPKLTLTVAVDEDNDVTEVPSSGLAYDLNPYMAVNFAGNQTYTNNGETQTFFFSQPKAQEYAQILWAVWDGEQFNMTTDIDDNYYGFTGSFTINPELNAYSTSGLKTNYSYNFKAIIRKSASKAGPYEVYPTDLNPDVPTAINGVVVNGNVKSVKYVNVAGMVSDVPFQGVNIVVTEYTDGSRTTTKMLKK